MWNFIWAVILLLVLGLKIFFFLLNFNVLITDKFHTKTTFLLILHYLIKTSNNWWNIFLCVVKSWNDNGWMSERRSFQGQNYLHEGEEVKNFNNKKTPVLWTGPGYRERVGPKVVSEGWLLIFRFGDKIDLMVEVFSGFCFVCLKLAFHIFFPPRIVPHSFP